MQELRNKLKNIIMWLFRWLKYILIIIIGFIYSLFKKEENPKIEKKKEETKPHKKKESQSNTETLPETFLPHTHNLFYLTKENLKEEIIDIYCNELRKKRYELTKKEDTLIDELTDIMLPIIEKEWSNKKRITSEKEREKIEERIREEFLKLEKKKEVSITPSFQIAGDEKTIKTVNSIFSNTSSILNEREKEKREERHLISKIEKKEELKKEEPQIKESPILNPINIPIKTEELKKEEAKVVDFITPSLIFPAISKEEKRKEEAVKENEGITKIESKKQNINHNSIEEQDKKEEAEEEKKKEQEEKKKLEKKEGIPIDLIHLEQEIILIKKQQEKEVKKENLEDKNYDELLEKVENLLKKVENAKKESENPENQRLLLEKEQKLKNIQNQLEQQQTDDLEKEKNWLEENIMETEISGLLNELKKLELEHQIDLNKEQIKKTEDLENLSASKQKEIEKELIKIKIKKASKTLELPSLLLFPFIRNRYFFMFTISILAYNHLNILDHLLHHKSVNITNPNLEQIKKGNDALNETLEITTTNIAYLNNLEQAILNKYPELSLDDEYLLYINKLRYSLLKNEEKMLKKKKMIKKYNLKYQANIRKLKKKIA